MTPDELRSLVDEATPGRWEKGGRRSPDGTVPIGRYSSGPGIKWAYAQREADARLIAFAPDLARLCAELGEALEEIASLEDQNELEKAIAQPALAKLSELEAK